ncbi:NAD(P)H-dependent glycerol-3-phosphate dehydrogenase [Herminiimonas sp. CN]|uniref:NAD(P)H-dependent glycerol-3-phosphate dehydrogenase n=1 Tax=Herminiimonas sp. CN TaxID=1349818 RepID=UPI000473DB4D|nr:NAD(P)H-dependent glycerol-3-phosphate dehydrogenase [Herminiimonas sp. CN]
MNITILGAGAWGTALAISLAERHRVVLWGRDAELIRDSAARRENFRYLPGIRLPDALDVSADFGYAVAHAAVDGLLVAAAPVAGLRGLLERLQPYAPANIIWLCKGFEERTRMLPHQVVRDVLGDFIPAGTLSGPSFAQEVARGLPCALTIATKSHDFRDHVVRAIHGGNIRVYWSEDLVGVEVGGAVKNILAIAAGIADGLGLGYNARAALITRGLTEITRLGVALGGRPETFMGLAGMGDLILTCTGDLSRNRQVGLGLAQGRPLAAIVADLGHVAEGVRCAQTVRALAHERKVSMPITEAVAGVLFDGDPVQQIVARLLARDPRDEAL